MKLTARIFKCVRLAAVCVIVSGALAGAGLLAQDEHDAGGSIAQPALREYDRADSGILRLPPDAFKDLPAAVIADLEQRGCTIPQVYSETPRTNVVRGRFTTAEQMDIAVLCSRNFISSILVFRGGLTNDVAELAQRPDLYYQAFAGPGGGDIDFYRMLGVADAAFIREHYAAYGGRPPPSLLDHEGIDEIFVEKASSVWYWYLGEWLRLTGSD